MKKIEYNDVIDDINSNYRCEFPNAPKIQLPTMIIIRVLIHHINTVLNNREPKS
jgi:hypothetical protein